ncbi:MAG: tyrosine-protein kinase [Pseudonocardiales bacterium]|jgi:succinoglycan biosynthesis transport protein ExoP|nr:tyrosine-protein kinase [Pseudonocardiales bacterium]
MNHNDRGESRSGNGSASVRPTDAGSQTGHDSHRGSRSHGGPWRMPLPERTVTRLPHGTRSFFRAHLMWISLVTAIVVAAALMLTLSRTAIYKSHADVLVQSRLLPGITSPQLPDMGTEKEVASSGIVIDGAARVLGVARSELQSGMSVTVPLNTHILRIGYASPNPGEAQRRAEVLADSYVAYWLELQPPARTASERALADAAQASKTAVITPAARPSKPASPNHVVDIGIAVVVGLGLGIGTAMMRDRFDDGLRGPADLELQAGSPVLAVMPALRASKYDPTARLVVVRDPRSHAAEAYQDLRTRVFRAATRRGAKTMLFTSAAGHEQTVVAANLAVTLAQAGRRVVLICADLRWPWGHELFGVDNEEGLAGVIEGHAEFDDAVRSTAIPGLQILPTGHVIGDDRAFLDAPRFRGLIGGLRGSTDFVIIDAPPVLRGADTVALTELVEMVVLVADAKKTSRGQTQAAVRQLDQARSKLIGCVLANVGRRTRLAEPALALVPADNDPGSGMTTVTSARPAERPGKLNGTEASSG